VQLSFSVFGYSAHLSFSTNLFFSHFAVATPAKVAQQKMTVLSALYGSNADAVLACEVKAVDLADLLHTHLFVHIQFFSQVSLNMHFDQLKDQLKPPCWPIEAINSRVQ
jgi:hypothetical protein